MDTWEIQNSSLDQRSWIQGFIGLMLASWERLDENTWNITVPTEKSDDVVEWAENENLPCRLV